MAAKRKPFKLTRWQAVVILLKVLERDDPFWGKLRDELYDEETDSFPSIYEVLGPIGITKHEIDHIKQEPKT